MPESPGLCTAVVLPMLSDGVSQDVCPGIELRHAHCHLYMNTTSWMFRSRPGVLDYIICAVLYAMTKIGTAMRYSAWA